jgi:hypothetical protein
VDRRLSEGGDSSVGFSFESQETVDRDHRGIWYLALK